jgi:hypothetical protein
MCRLGGLVDHDTFTHTIAGHEIHNQNWLAELLLYGLFEVGGIDLIQFTVGLCYASAVATVTYAAWHRCRNVRVASFLATAALGLALSNISLRTQAFAAVLFTLELTALWCWSGSKRMLGTIALAEVLWTNVHGSFPLGVLLPAIFTAGAALRRVLPHDSRSPLDDRGLRTYAWSTIAAFAAMFANPTPGQTLSYVTNVASKASARGVEEWAPTDLTTYAGVGFAVSALLILAVLPFAHRVLDPTGWLLLAAFAVLGLKAQRLVMWWAFAIPTVLAPALRSVLRNHKFGTRPQTQASTGPVVVLTAIGLLLLMSTPWTRSHNLLLPRFKRASLSSTEPQAAVDFLKHHGRYQRLFNPMEWGGYLSWQLDGDCKVFIDPRVDFFPDKVWDDYVTIGKAAPGWQQTLDVHRVDLVLWDPRLAALPAALAGSERWHNVYRDEQVTIFARVSPLIAATADTGQPRLSPAEVGSRAFSGCDLHVTAHRDRLSPLCRCGRCGAPARTLYAPRQTCLVA